VVAVLSVGLELTATMFLPLLEETAKTRPVLDVTVC